jgi:hypothetical protein
MDKVEYAVETLPVVISPKVTWVVCGEPNSYTLPHGNILLCDEIMAMGLGYARFTALHEMGHETIAEYAIPITGPEEAAADDFAVVMSVMEGNPGDVIETAQIFESWAAFMPRSATDVHPSFGDRAIRMRQLLRGMLGEESFKGEWSQAVRSWYALTRPGLRVGVK